MSKSSRSLWVVIGVLVVLLVVVYFWKGFAVRSVERRLEVQRAESVEAMRAALTAQAGELLRLAAVPLGWSVRTEAIKEDFDQIDDYMRRIVKERHVERVLFVDHEGMVRLSSDKKLEEQRAVEILPAEALRADDVVVLDDVDGEMVVAVPVAGYDARLGTLILGYSREAIEARLPREPAG